MADQYDIIVCGDSFCCASHLDLRLVGSRAHFSQILEDSWGYRVLNLAHGGVSNTCILWQMREAVDLAPRAIVYNRTFEGRVDIMLNDQFDRKNGLRNWAYWEDHFTSFDTKYTARIGSNMPQPSVVSTVHQGLEQNTRLGLDSAQLFAVKTWLTYFFNWDMALEMNDWHFEYWHQRIQNLGIQPLPFNHQRVGALAWEFSEKNKEFDSPFHTDRNTQQKIAENIHVLLQSGEQLPAARARWDI